MSAAYIPEVPEVDDREANVSFNNKSVVGMITVVKRVHRCRHTADCATQTTFLRRYTPAQHSQIHNMIVMINTQANAKLFEFHKCRLIGIM